MNINFGLTDYGRLKYMLEMADLLKKKKLYEALQSEDPKNAKHQEMIDKTQ